MAWTGAKLEVTLGASARMLRPGNVVKLSIASFCPLEVIDRSKPMDSGVTWYMKSSIEGGDGDSEEEEGEEEEEEGPDPFPPLARHARCSFVRLLMSLGGRALCPTVQSKAWMLHGVPAKAASSKSHMLLLLEEEREEGEEDIIGLELPL